MHSTATEHPTWCRRDLCVTGHEDRVWQPPPGRSWGEFADRIVHSGEPAHFHCRTGSLEARVVQAEGDDTVVVLVGHNPESDVILTLPELTSVSAWLLGLKEAARGAL